MKTKINEETIAENNETIVIEGNQKKKKKKKKKEFFKESNTHSTCPWKGYASYFIVEVNGTTNKDAAWYYPDPSDRVKEIKDYVAFWNGVKIIE